MSQEVFIEFKNIDKSFGDNVVYKDLNLKIFRGETLTIMGGSGTGKSVLIKMLLRLLEPDSGEIIFDGENILKLDRQGMQRVRRRVGMLFQGAALFDSLTVFENIAYPLREHYDYSESKLREIVGDKLERVGLPGIEEMMPADLSGGMKKRVGLARAIATDAEVILYDEPTTGLDPTNTNRIDHLIRQLQEKLKVTSIVVTHDMGSAFRVSDRLALVYNKKIEYVGTKEEIRNSDNPIVTRFIGGQIGA